MGTWQYRALRANGSVVTGAIDAASDGEALAELRRTGATPVELRLVETPAASRGAGRAPRSPRKYRAAAQTLIGELAVLLNAGLPLDRALALAIGNVEDKAAASAMADLLRAVREGSPLSRAMLDNPQLFSPAEAAMAEAGEANGRLGEALTRLSTMLEQAAELRRILVTSMIYPAALLIIAVGVILLMLLFVVPQFERLLEGGHADLPASSRAVIGASRFVRDYGLWLLAGLIAGGFGLRQLLGRPGARRWLDGLMLRIPQLGELVRRIDTARFAHTLGALVDGGVALPVALLLARRTINNSVIGDAVQRVAEGVREGGGLTAPLASAHVFPQLAIGFLRTGEEASQLGLMLGRLAAVLDKDVRTRLQRLVAILTPAITVVLGTVVAGIVASIMSAILGFNDLAVSQ
jgi:general secretion pathway protein F